MRTAGAPLSTTLHDEPMKAVGWTLTGAGAVLGTGAARFVLGPFAIAFLAAPSPLGAGAVIRRPASCPTRRSPST